MIRCLVVDDELYATKIIADHIGKVAYLELAGTTTSAVAALSLVQQGGIDLVFLDIQMPELTGIQFLKLYGGKCKVILTTAYPEYALDGFEHDVVDYLLKPIAFDRFLRAVGKVNEMIGALAPTSAPVDHIFVKGDSKHKFIRIAYRDILYVEGLKNYVSIYTTAGQRVVTYQSMRDMEELLPQPLFFRVHRSFIISADKISMVDGNVVYIGEQAVPVGETYREGFFRLFL